MENTNETFRLEMTFPSDGPKVNETELRAYLLGRLPEADAARLEERFLDDDELFETLRGVEDDLVDEFAQGRMSNTDARAFAGRTEGQENRVRFAHALSKRAAKAVPPRSRPLWIPFAIAATLVLALGFPSFLTRPVQAPVREPAGTSAAAPDDVALTVLIATTRSASPGGEVELPGNAARLRLSVTLDPEDRFDRYRLELRSPAGNVVYRGDDLLAAAEKGTLRLAADIPASLLVEGAHELEVAGLRPGGAPEPLGFAAIRIRRSP